MQCTKPIYLESEKMVVPCQKCRACRISRSREWSTRIMHEMSYHDNSIFVTLTYDNDHLPSDLSLQKKELQRFFKRLRKRLGDRSVKYYASGEYGEQRGRPHYHAIIFGMSLAKEDKDIIQSAWPNGLMHKKNFGTVTYQSARYVCDYIQKDNRASTYGRRTPPFSLMSQGIGKQYAIENGAEIIENLSIRIDGSENGIPKYYRKVLDITTEMVAEKAAEKAKEELEFYHKKYMTSDGELIYPEAKKSRRQKNKTIMAKEKLYKKGKF